MISILTLAVLTFEDQPGDPEAAHWRYMIERLVAEELVEAKALRRVPAAFGYRQLFNHCWPTRIHDV